MNQDLDDANSGKLLYVVETTTRSSNKRAVTEVRTAGGMALARFEWRGYRSDIVTLGLGAEPMPSSNWIKRSLIPFKDSVSFRDEPWKSFKWKNFAPALSLELYEESDKSTPLAWFRKSSRGTAPAALEISPRLAASASPSELLDRIVVSFLYLEKVRREHDEDDFGAVSGQRSRGNARAWI